MPFEIGEFGVTEQTSDPHSSPEDEHPPSTRDRVGEAIAALKSAGDRGANWFFWIAALSLVNTAITHFGGDRRFMVGLGITAIIDFVTAAVGKGEPTMALISMLVAVGFSIFVAGEVTLFGWLSRKRVLWVFGFGMFLYLLDALLCLLLTDLLSAGFHGYALYAMLAGFNAYRKLRRLEMAAEGTTASRGELLVRNPNTGFETV